MAIALVQSAFSSNIVANPAQVTSSPTGTLPSPATAGNTLLAVFGIDKNSGAVTTPSGWTELITIVGASISLVVFGKTAAGGEQSVSVTWTTPQWGATGVIAEYTGVASFGPAWGAPYSDTARTSMALGPVTATGAGKALGIFASDSLATTTGLNPAATGWTQVLQAYEAASPTGGGPGVTLVERTAATADGVAVPSTTFTWTNSDQTSGALLLLVEGTAPAPAPTKTSLWAGIPSSSGIVAQLTGANLVAPRLRVSTSSAMTSPIDGPTATPASGVARLTVTGLAADTVYYYKVEDSGTVLDGGSFRTLPTAGAATSFRFAYSSCLDNSYGDPTILTDVASRSPLFFLWTGDLGYPDAYHSATVAGLRANYDQVLGYSSMRSMMSTVPMDYVYDDHDGTLVNDGYGGSPGMALASQVYRERVPYPASIPSTTGVYRTWVVGRVRFIMLDCRAFRSINSATDDSSKTMLGTTQKTWLQNLLATATEPLMFIVSSVPWVAPTTAGGDDWGGFNTERVEIGGWLTDSGKRAVFLCGDAHMLAYDDGTNSVADAPVWQAAPVLNDASFKGGAYSGGNYPASGVTGQYAYVDITDTDGTLTATWTGVKSDGTTWATTSETTVPAIVTDLWDGTQLVRQRVDRWDGTALVEQVLASSA